MKRLIFILLLLTIIATAAAERKTTDLIVIIRVPRDPAVEAIRPLRPAAITALRQESYNIYDAYTKTFLCVMTVAVEDYGAMRSEIAKYNAEEAEEITVEKIAPLYFIFPTLAEIEAQVQENIQYAGETEAEFKIRKNF